MILLLDVGNTRIKWRVVQAAGTPAMAEGALGHAEVHGLQAIVAGFPALRRMVGSNVAGASLGAALDGMLTTAGIAGRWVQAARDEHGVRNGYDRPAQLGTDRWAALIGARRLHGGPCLVVSAGTATTVDHLDADGQFQGGLILPGIDLMRQSLASNTSGLRLEDGRVTPHPRNTADAIESGCAMAQAGAVERMFGQLAPQEDALCVLTGGAAPRFADLLSVRTRAVPNLVLDGLAVIAAADAADS